MAFTRRRSTFLRTGRRSPARIIKVFPAGNNVTPAAMNNDDLLLNFKNLAGITINLPEFTIWRIHLKISLRFTVTAAAANNGVLIAAFVDDIAQTQINLQATPSAQNSMMWEMMYAAEQVMMGGTVPAGPFDLHRVWDIKSHRRIKALSDTLIFQTAASGNAVLTDYSYQGVVLLREQR